jgi:lipoate-protein ligase A
VQAEVSQMIELPIARWRLIRHPPDSGAWNMAVDEAILEAVGQGAVPPTLRLYAWRPPCLSLGYAQAVTDVDHQALAARGWQLVRRPTGGRAILHTDELTYSVIGPLDELRLAGGVLESYQRLSRALLAALHQLGIAAAAQESRAAQDLANPVCFEVPSNYEITLDGKKLIGSAQARRQGGVLQHGSLPLQGDLARITQVLRFTDETARAVAATRLLERAATAEAALGYPLAWESAAQAFAAAFARQLHLEWMPGELTQPEQARAEELAREKYAHPGWTERV